MSRQYNPAIPTYNRLNAQIANKSRSQKSETKSGGLLSPREDKVKLGMDEDINQPITRVMEHMMAIQKYKADKNA